MTLSSIERSRLEEWSLTDPTQSGLAQRARIVLHTAAGRSPHEIAADLLPVTSAPSHADF